MTSSLQETLQKVGMEPTITEIYLILIENGEMTVPHILEKTQLSRATVYEALPILLAQGFLEYRKEGRVAYYKPTHPSKLFNLVEEQKREVALLEGEMNETIKSITGLYNLASSKPGVRFFEGIEGLREALFDTLTAKTEICSFINLDEVNRFAGDLNREYVEKRKEKNIQKKILTFDTQTIRDYFRSIGTDLTDFRFFAKDMIPFEANMQIYDNKISYFTLREKNINAFIIEDPQVAMIQKSLFDFVWKQASTITL